MVSDSELNADEQEKAKELGDEDWLVGVRLTRPLSTQPQKLN